MKPIETVYAGCRFRSRLEARWAVFFDALGVRWEYEPEGFELPSGRYLPDFWLPEVWSAHRPADLQLGAWFEVKPDDRRDDDPRWNELARASAPVFVARGMPRPDQDLAFHDGGHSFIEVYDGDWWDNGRTFCLAHGAGGVALDFFCASYRDPRIVAAYQTARSARFEFGEHGSRP